MLELELSTTSIRFAFSIGTRVQYTQPPNGSLNGTPSTSTSVRLTPLGPMPRSETPCAVGCDDRLLLRRNRLNVGTCLSTSSATTAGDCRMVSFSMMLALTGTSPRAFSLRVGVTVTVSNNVAILRTTLISFEGATDADHSANPPARTTIVTLPPGTPESVKRPSGPVTVCNSGPPVPRTLIDAPETAPPASSRTTPETADWAAAALARARERMSTKAVRMIAPY